MHPILFRFGELAFHAYSFGWALAILVGTAIIVRALKYRGGLDVELGLEAMVLIMAAALAGCRLLCVVRNWSYFSVHWQEIFAFRFVNLNFIGAIPAVFLVGYLWCRWRRLNFWRLADIFCTYILVSYAFVRCGCFLNGCCYGKPAAVPWAVVMPAVDHLPRHPVQLYGAAGAIIIVVILHHTLKRQYFAGINLFAFIGLYGILRLVTDFFREEQIFWAGLSQNQLLSIAITVISAAAILIIYFRNKRTKNN